MSSCVTAPSKFAMFCIDVRTYVREGGRSGRKTVAGTYSNLVIPVVLIAAVIVVVLKIVVVRVVAVSYTHLTLPTIYSV